MIPSVVKQTRLLMGMPITVEVVDPSATDQVLEDVFGYFEYVDEKFSTYKPFSEISLINAGVLTLEETSFDMQSVFKLCEAFQQETGGYFNIQHKGRYDPSGLVKGWAISNAAERVRLAGFHDYYVEAGGDFQAAGKNSKGQDWRVGIRSPFNMNEIVKVLSVTNCGVATSGTYIRGQHIYNPLADDAEIHDILSMTVIGPDILEADVFATAAFAMGKDGIGFIETLEGFEGYMIDQNRLATFTSGFGRYIAHDPLD